jgi:hypothetical protein
MFENIKTYNKMPNSKLSIIDDLAEGIGAPLRDEDISVILFGDSPVEEETRPDSDMTEDDMQIGRALNDFRRVIEAIPLEKNWSEEFRKINPIQSKDSEFAIDYFIDGSIRTKYVGELVSNKGTGGPLVVANVGAVSVKIDYSKWKVVPSGFLSKVLVYLTQDIPDTTQQMIKSKLKSLMIPVEVEFLAQGETEANLRTSAGGKARSEMHKTEISLATSIPLDRRWLAVDGALRKKEFMELNKAIGIAKSFSRKVVFIGGGKPKSISHLSKMKKWERSKIYRYRIVGENKESEEQEALEKVAFWYLRIRQPPPEMMPLGGIVKVDLSYSEEMEPNITSLVDGLSDSILKLADPSIFPRPRWPSFVYPVRVAEEYLGPSLYSNDEFMRLGITLKRVMYDNR